MEKLINMLDYATTVCMPKNGITNAEHQALRDITQPIIDESRKLALQALASVKADAETSKKALEEQYAEWTEKFKDSMSTKVYIDLAGAAAAMAAYQKMIDTISVYERIYR